MIPLLHVLRTEPDEDMTRSMAGGINLLAGNSGVGKSTIINDLIPGCLYVLAEISSNMIPDSIQLHFQRPTHFRLEVG